MQQRNWAAPTVHGSMPSASLPSPDRHGRYTRLPGTDSGQTTTGEGWYLYRPRSVETLYFQIAGDHVLPPDRPCQGSQATTLHPCSILSLCCYTLDAPSPSSIKTARLGGTTVDEKKSKQRASRQPVCLYLSGRVDLHEGGRRRNQKRMMCGYHDRCQHTYSANTPDWGLGEGPQVHNSSILQT
jgi:hypothetical protein